MYISNRAKLLQMFLVCVSTAQTGVATVKRTFRIPNLRIPLFACFFVRVFSG